MSFLDVSVYFCYRPDVLHLMQSWFRFFFLCVLSILRCSDLSCREISSKFMLSGRHDELGA